MKATSSNRLISRLQDPETGSHGYLWLLLFYPVYLTSFFILEKVTLNYHVVECAADRFIPFCEWFFIPYVLWHGAIALLTLHLLLNDIPELKRLLRYFIATYIITFSVFLIWPTCQNLRPNSFPRDNLLTWLVAHVIYGADPSTNVSPSMHIIGTFGLWFAVFRTKGFAKMGWRIFWTLLCLSICLSTVFLRQHSLLDLATALPVVLVGWLVAYSGLPERRKSAP
ncbi:MAG: hypothetical protein MJ075_02265 [Oscillospiraceae bacterium]|nr:hypothetical protein [Oscillospiraceae bacterium]